ncbi:hypothetical protein AB4Y38_24595 [Paraburkholderia sp. EG285A]|uniref:hypothetical protein n=1 Tax=Paraburkholderia sp. EG285A TaxID=3237009 RepID=UPI0034D17A19
MKNLLASVGRLIRAMGAKSAGRRDPLQHFSLLQPAVVSRHTARMPGSVRRARSQGER